MILPVSFHTLTEDIILQSFIYSFVYKLHDLQFELQGSNFLNRFRKDMYDAFIGGENGKALSSHLCMEAGLL